MSHATVLEYAPALLECAPTLFRRADTLNDQLRSHIRDHFTTVQLTLLSIIVALVLENLLSAFWDRETPDQFDLTTALWWFQVALILLSSISAWAGFGLSMSVNSRRVNFVDVLAPFALLIALNLAVGVLHPGNIAAYLLAIGVASLIAGLMLLSDVQDFSTVIGGQSDGNIEGPTRAMRLQLSMAAWDFAGVLLLLLGVIETLGGCIVIALACVGQSVGLAGTIRGWRSVT